MLLIRDALLQGQRLGLDRLDAQWLLLHVLSSSSPPAALGTAHTPSRSWLLAHDDQPLTDAQQQAWQHAAQRRAAGEPLAYVVGEHTFCGLQLKVSPAVLIPRPETEGLVDWAMQCLQTLQTPAPRVLDMGTGSGAIALAIQHRCPAAAVWATDISAAALAVAADNAQRLRLSINLNLQDWWQPVNPASDSRGAPTMPLPDRFDLVVSNPPYIAPGDRHLQALQHEPVAALVGAAGGLGDLQTIIGGAFSRLSPGGWLLLEHGHDQATALQGSLRHAGFQDVQTRVDLADLPRCTGGRHPG